VWAEGDDKLLLEEDEAKEEAAHRPHGPSLLGAVAHSLHLPHLPWVSSHHQPSSPRSDTRCRASAHHDSVFDHEDASSEEQGRGQAEDLWKLIGAHYDDLEAQVVK
jgi:hypothetical protein